MKLLGKGAEATVHEDGSFVLKTRNSKTYRNKILDEKLRSERTKAEAKNMKKLKGLAPNVIEAKKYEIKMEKIEGLHVREILAKQPKKLGKQIGEACQTMHNANISHGDLTTTNMFLQKQKIRLIDFGLSKSNARVEDKAVDLNIFKQVLNSTHTNQAQKVWEAFKTTYKPKQKTEIMKRLQKIESRGRYK